MNLLRVAQRVITASVLMAGALAVVSTSSSAGTAPTHTAPTLSTPHATGPASGCSMPPPATGDHCLPISAVVTGTVATASGVCSAIVVLQLTLNPNIVQYNATWVPAGQSGAGTTYSAPGGPSPGVTSSTGSWTTGSVAYGTLTYTVPKGDGVWFLGQGSGPAPCTSAGPGSVQAWGWTGHAVVRGHVTFKGSGAPAPGITVNAKCASGGSTTTDSYGAYGFLLNPGSCTIAPTLTKGEVSAPTQRVVVVASQDITNVDFVIPGGALKLFVKTIEPPRSGLAVHNIHYTQFPADFLASAFDGGGPARFVCQSGCSDITVGVVDPATGKAPAPHATVDVSLGQFSAGSVSFAGQVVSRQLGLSEICTTAADGQDKDCGTSLHGLDTDADGQLRLRYWTPGVIAPSSATLTVTARCDVKPCQASPTTTAITLAVEPYEIYQHTSTLSVDDVNEMSEWSNGGNAFTSWLEKSVTGFNVLKAAIKVLEANERAEEALEETAEVFEKIHPYALAFDVGFAFNKILEAKGMMAMFLDDSGLSAFGVGDDPTEPSIFDFNDPSVLFQNELVNQIEVPEFLKLGDGGFWWASAGTIHEVLNAYGEGQATGWTLGTTVFETSHCTSPEGDDCGPGYRNDVGSSILNRPGIAPELTFELALSHNGGAPLVALDFDIRYDALAWTTTQPDLQGVIKDR